MTRSDISGFEFTLLLSYMAAYKADQTMGGTAMKTTQNCMVCIHDGLNGCLVCQFTDIHSDNSGRPNAVSLIAAAPAMYEALLAVCATVCLNDDGTRFYAIDRKTERKITHSLSAARGEE